MKLQSDPDGVRVAAPVVLGQRGLGRVLLVVDVLPPWRLGEEEDEHDDQAAEDELHPGDEAPGEVSALLNGAEIGAGTEDGTAEPQGVVHGWG